MPEVDWLNPVHGPRISLAELRKRRKVVRFPGRLLHDLFCWDSEGFIKLPVIPGVRGTMLLDIWYDQMRQHFNVVLCHPDWEAVPEGAEPPVADISCIKVDVPWTAHKEAAQQPNPWLEGSGIGEP